MVERQELVRLWAPTRWLVAAALVLLPATATVAQGGAEQPWLRIEAGTHVAQTNNAATDDEGRVLVTGSYDKTARVWSLPDLRLLDVLRPPIGKDQEGQINAVAISPDGRLVAVGGWSTDFWLFDLQSRHIVRGFRIAETELITWLAFSPDGKRLAAGLGANGIRVWRVADGEQVAQDSAYQGDISGLAFSPDGRLVTASYDGSLRLYDTSGHLVRKVSTEAGRQPFQVGFSPDGRSLAVGFMDAVAVEVRDGTTLALAYRPDVSGLHGTFLTTVNWSRDGRTLYAGNDPTQGVRRRPVFAWTDAGKGTRRIAARGFSVGPSSIVPLPNGTLAFVSVRGDLAVVGPDGSVLKERPSGAINLVDAPRLPLSRDGTEVEWVTDDAQDRWLYFDARAVELTTHRAPREGLTDWSAKAGNLRVTGWEGRTPKLNGRPLQLDSNEDARSVALESSRVLLGGDWYLRLFDGNAKPLWPQPASIPSPAFRVNLSPDGRLAVAALGDGTIRWYRVRDGAELLALFLTADAKRWVAFTPSGYYAASPAGEDLFGWHVNRGPDREADFFPAARFRERFYRPDVVSRVLATLDEAAALREADAERGTSMAAAVPDVRKSLPPVVTILSPKDGTTVQPAGETQLRVQVRSPSGAPITGLRVLADARPLATARVGAARALAPATPGEALQEREIDIDVSAFAGRDVSLAVIAQADAGSSVAARVLMKVAPAPLAAVPQEPRKPMLYGVIVGVSAYQRDSMRLKLAAKDADDFAKALRRQKGGLYRDVELHVLRDAEVNRTSVLDALRWLERSTTRADTAVLFLAGHGINTEDREYFFLPPDADPDQPESAGVSGTDLRRPLRPMAGRVLVFLDTCYGGALFTQRTRAVPDMTNVLNEMLASNDGTVVFSATTGRTRAEERDDLNNGVFTSALLHSLQVGTAGGQIRILGLADYLTEEVKRLTGGRQKADYISPEGMPNVPIFLARP